MALRPAHNPSDQPIVIDEDGHTLGGGEWGAVDPNEPSVLAAVAGGSLVIPDDLGPSPSDAAKAAADAAGKQPKRPAASTSSSSEEENG